MIFLDLVPHLACSSVLASSLVTKSWLQMSHSSIQRSSSVRKRNNLMLKILKMLVDTLCMRCAVLIVKEFGRESVALMSFSRYVNAFVCASSRYRSHFYLRRNSSATRNWTSWKTGNSICSAFCKNWHAILSYWIHLNFWLSLGLFLEKKSKKPWKICTPWQLWANIVAFVKSQQLMNQITTLTLKTLPWKN